MSTLLALTSGLLALASGLLTLASELLALASSLLAGIKLHLSCIILWSVGSCFLMCDENHVVMLNTHVSSKIENTSQGELGLWLLFVVNLVHNQDYWGQWGHSHMVIR